jgi:C1A family cysteine protease
MHKFIPGWIKDSADKHVKDWNAQLLIDRVTERPSQVSLRYLILTILNQLNLGSCVTNAGAQGIRAALVKAGDMRAKLLSRLFAYYYARAISPGNTSVDSGTQIRCFFDVIARIGYCPEEAWPYDITKFTKMPGSEALRAAFDQKTSVGYYRIFSTGKQRVSDICTAVAGGHTVVFGTQVGMDFMTWRPGDPALLPPSRSEGGHALLVAGYAPGPSEASIVFDICNSWGPDYGDGGYCTMADDYLAWDETADLWIVENTPIFSAA